MRYLSVVLVCVCAVASAGPVGEYLGYRLDRVQTGIHEQKDSVHIYLPTPSDTVMTRVFNDTSTVIAETLYEGRPAWITNRVESLNSVVDTAVEFGDTLLRERVVYGDIALWAHMYRVPFQIGAWWRTGLAGTYYIDINGDSIKDTLTIWGDTTRVLARETVTVPFGTIPDCYKLLTVTRQSLAMVESSIPIRETSHVRMYQWYKDSMGWVQDSSRIDARVYARILIWLRFADIVSEGFGQLTDHYVGIEERPGLQVPSLTLRAWPNPFRTAVSLQLAAESSAGLKSSVHPAVRIYDALGRCVRTLSGRGPGSGVRDSGPEPRAPSPVFLTWDGLDDKGRPVPPGLYLIRGPTGSCLVTRAR